MATLTKANYDDVLDFTLSKACKISRDSKGKEAGEHKTINLEVSYKGLTFKEACAKMLKGDVIAWQNGSNGRKNYDKHVNGAVVKIQASSPGSHYIDPEEAVIDSFGNKSPEEQEAYMAKLKAIMAKSKTKK